MKKFVFLFAMVFAVSMLMAQQSVSDINSSGVTNSVSVDQTNISEPVPGVSLYSWVGQDGTTNIAEVVQEVTTPIKPEEVMEAYIDQLGVLNKAKQIQGPSAKQGGTFALIHQEGTSNDAWQQQIYYHNSAEIWQYGMGNVAKQAQDVLLPPESPGSSNNAYALQNGEFNVSEQEQNGWSNSANVNQDGVGNQAYQTQQNYSWVSDATIEQTGTGNIATEDQIGFLNSALVHQEGQFNEATQTQSSDGERESAIYDPLNRGEVFQFGTGNIATQMQTMPDELPIDIGANFATVTQSGVGNNSSQTQYGGNNSSSCIQTGEFNSAVLTQSQSIVQ
jgi:hypothetical protein